MLDIENDYTPVSCKECGKTAIEPC